WLGSALKKPSTWWGRQLVAVFADPGERATRDRSLHQVRLGLRLVNLTSQDHRESPLSRHANRHAPAPQRIRGSTRSRTPPRLPVGLAPLKTRPRRGSVG